MKTNCLRVDNFKYDQFKRCKTSTLVNSINIMQKITQKCKLLISLWAQSCKEVKGRKRDLSHPDLNMSEFSKLAIGKSCLGKVVRFFYSFTLRRMGRPAPFYEGYLFCFFGGGERSPKNNYQLHSIIGVARHLWRRCLSFCGKWKLWHRWPKYLSHGNRAFSEKRRKHFPTFSLLSLLDSLTHTSHGRGR